MLRAISFEDLETMVIDVDRFTRTELDEEWESLPPAITYEQIEKVLEDFQKKKEFDGYDQGYNYALYDVKLALKTMMDVEV